MALVLLLGAVSLIAQSAQFSWTLEKAPGARSWRIALSADGLYIAAVDGPDALSSGEIWTSSDGGKTWIDRKSDGQRFWMTIASSADGLRLAAADRGAIEGGNIVTSDDGGKTWTERKSAGKGEWRAIASNADGLRLAAADYGFYSEAPGILGTDLDAGYLWTSADGGKTWAERKNAGRRNWVAVTSCANGLRLAAVARGGGHAAVGADVMAGNIWTSDDGGSTWIRQKSAGRRLWNSIASSADGLQIVAACGYDDEALEDALEDGTALTNIPCVGAGDGDIWASSDGGKTWRALEASGKMRYWGEIASSGDGRRLFAASVLDEDIPNDIDRDAPGIGGLIWMGVSSSR